MGMAGTNQPAVPFRILLLDSEACGEPTAHSAGTNSVPVDSFRAPSL